MTNVIRETENKGIYWLDCPGCDAPHQVNTIQSNQGPCWGFNGSLEKPTFTPSILCKYPWGEDQKMVVCHSFVRDGVWEFLGDCTHDLAGKKVPMELEAYAEA